MVDPKGKPVDPNKIELTRLRLTKMQLRDSKRVLLSQDINQESKQLKLESNNKALLDVNARISRLKLTSNLR